ncbi:acyltransferase family protein [Mycobacterium sp.]|uniref:acyltransferase family protein n=1 Tax=Mycobacterium sp. TaxID=1785 RepID=UPI003BB15777
MDQRIPATGDLYHRTTAGRPRIESLTGLRWCAALAVFLSHNVPGGRTPPIISTFFSSGYIGVTLFFVLSGFVLTVTYGDVIAERRKAGIWNYAVARMARVMPLYWLILLFVVVVWVSFSPAATTAGLWWHFLAIQAWTGDVKLAYSWNSPGWSVGVELFLYAMFPLLVLLAGVLTSTRKVITVACFVVAAMATLVILFHLTGNDKLPLSDPASAHRWIYRSPLMRLGDFTLGICGALIYARERSRACLIKTAPLVAVAMSLLIMGLMMVPQLLNSSPSYDLAYAVPGAVLILSLALSPHRGIARFLGSVTLVALGELSYAFYLIHAPVGAQFQRWGVSSNGFTLVSGMVLILCLLFLIALSWGLHVSFERPARIFLRKRLSISPSRTPEPRSQPAMEG